MIRKSLFFLLITLIFTGCSAAPQTNTQKCSVLSVGFAGYSFAAEIAGDKADISMLLSPGEESHSFEPTPKDMIQIQNADLVIIVGGESDEWVKTILTAQNTDTKKILSMTEVIPPVEESNEGIAAASHNHTHEHNDDNVHEDHAKNHEYDEHVWTNPANASAIAAEIADRLCEFDPQNQTTYTENLHHYQNALQELDRAFQEVCRNSSRDCIVFGDRFPFRYFADKYNLLYYAAFPGCSAETEPDAKTMKYLIDKVKEEQIPVVFYTELSNRSVCDAICEATGAKPMLLHSCHSITKDQFARGETYLTLMQKNIVALKEALS